MRGRRSGERRAESGRESGIVDDRLRLIFTCCHPALAPEARVALTLRTLGGLTTPEIARAFLLPEPTLAQRLVRAKRKIRDAGIPYRVPPAHLLPSASTPCSRSLYLVFNEGYAATSGEAWSGASSATRRSGSAALLAELHARRAGGARAARADAAPRRAARGAASTPRRPGAARRPGPGRWDRVRIAEGDGAGERSLACGGPGPYQLQAAIAAVHAEAPRAAATDWPQICVLYDALLRMRPSPVVELNRAAAIAMATVRGGAGPRSTPCGQDGELDGYHLFHSATGRAAAEAGSRRRGGRSLPARAPDRHQPDGATLPGAPAARRGRPGRPN